MGENRWRFYSDWPVPGASALDLYLDSGGNANTRLGDGQLSWCPPVLGIPDHYLYNPEDPVPTLGGALLMPGLFPPGPKEQAPVEARQDVLSFTSEKLTEDLTVLGPVSLTLFVSSSAPDTDFVARLIDVFPDGKAYNLTDGIIRASYRQVNWADPTSIRAHLLESDQIYSLTIDLWATANTFMRNHRIRLDIASSNFPRWDRNLNTGNSGIETAQMSTAQQTIYHDNGHPSVLHLQQVPQLV
jgi:putative CocE/NonD family hydrolase